MYVVEIYCFDSLKSGDCSTGYAKACKRSDGSWTYVTIDTHARATRFQEKWQAEKVRKRFDSHDVVGLGALIRHISDLD